MSTTDHEHILLQVGAAKVSCPACSEQVFRVKGTKPAGVTLMCCECETVFFRKMAVLKPPKQPKPPAKPKATKKKTRKRKTVAKAVAKQRAKTDGKKPAKRTGPLKDPQQEMFCRYCVDASPTEAARRAGYSENSLTCQPYRMLENARIRARIQELMDELTDDLFINKQNVVRMLWERANACLSDYVTKGADGLVYIDFGKDVPNPKAIKKLKVKQLFDDDGNMKGMIDEIELHDALRAIQILCDVMGYKAPEERKVAGEIIVRSMVPEPKPPPKEKKG